MKTNCFLLLLLWSFFLTLAPGKASAQPGSPWFTCSATSFRTIFSIPGASVRVHDVLPLDDSGFLVAGDYAQPGLNYVPGFVGRLDARGNVVWMKAFNKPPQAIVTSDEGRLASGGPGLFFWSTASFKGFLPCVALVKFRTDGTVLWKKDYGTQPWCGASQKLRPSGDGGVFMAGLRGDGSGDGFFASVDSSGYLRWGKSFRNAGMYDFVLRPTAVYLVGSGFPRPISDAIGHLVKLDRNSGDTVWTRCFAAGVGVPTEFEDISDGGDTLLVTGSVYFPNQPGHVAVWRFDSSGRLLRSVAYQFADINQVGFGALRINADGREGVLHHSMSTLYFEEQSGVWAGYRDSVTGARDYLLRTKLPGKAFLATLSYEPAPAAPTQVLFFRPDSLAQLPCAVLPDLVTTTSLPLQDTVFNRALTPFYDPGIPSLIAEIPMPAWTMDQRCSGGVACAVSRIDGPASPCARLPVSYEVQMSGDCARVTFSAAPADARITPLANGKASVEFLRNGPVWLYATATGRCGTYYDSLLVQVRVGAPQLNLGPDLYLCPGGSRQLSTGPGYTGHLWQDGSGGSTFTVLQPGLYYVQVSDGCSVTFTDSVLVQPFANATLSLGADRAICPGDTATVALPPGFDLYSWTPAASVSSPAGPRSLLHPPVTTDFYLEATQLPNCSLRDTLNVALLPVPLRDLGADTSICPGTLLRLDAGNGLVSYSWSTGARGAFIDAGDPGVYSVHVSAANGCSAADSITLTLANCLPGLFVPTAFTPNGDGRNDLLRPLVYAHLLSFDFRLYNRWGQLVFATRSPNVGWDGAFGGRKQDTGNYVWYCAYQVEGEAPQQRKGSVLLLR